MKFKSKKSVVVGMIVWSVSLFVPSIIIIDILQNNRPWITLLIILPALFPIWIWFDTFYTIEDGQIKYKSAFIKGSISIVDIREVIIGKTLFVGLKPALASKGLIIKYNRWDEIYISPENQQLFNEQLLKINPNIKMLNTI